MARKSHGPSPEGKRLHELDIAVPQDDKEVRSLRERAMLVRLSMGSWRGAGKDDEVTEDLRVKNEAKGKVGTFIKRFMSREELQPIYQARSAARRFHKGLTLPWGDSGYRLLSVMEFFNYKRQMTALEREFWKAVEAFLLRYAKAVEEQKPRLGKLWRASDYPSVEELRGMFRFQCTVEPIPTSDDFRVRLSTEETAEIKREYEVEVRSRLKGAVQDVFANVQEVVAELRDKLADPDAQVRQSTFGSLRKLVSSLPQLNSMVQDPNIAALGKRIADDLLSVSTDAVAHDVTERSKLQRKADGILAALKPLQSSWSTQ